MLSRIFSKFVRFQLHRLNKNLKKITWRLRLKQQWCHTLCKLVLFWDEAFTAQSRNMSKMTKRSFFEEIMQKCKLCRDIHRLWSTLFQKCVLKLEAVYFYTKIYIIYSKISALKSEQNWRGWNMRRRCLRDGRPCVGLYLKQQNESELGLELLLCDVVRICTGNKIMNRNIDP